jgi:hypothetical protein
MKNTKLILAALLALGGLASANAITVSASDLILGFSRSGTSGTGVGSSLEVNLGSVASLTTLSGGSEYFLGQSVLNLADIQSFGSGATWQATQVTWGVAGATDSGDAAVWGTVKSGSVVGTPGANQGTVSNKIQGMYTSAAGGLGGESATANSTRAALVNNAGSQAWKTNATANLNFSYSPWTNKLVQSTASLGTLAFQSAELYKFNQAGVAEDVGTFKLYQNGDFSFTSFAAIPEPSTYAAILGAATLGFVMIRRRKQQQLLA